MTVRAGEKFTGTVSSDFPFDRIELFNATPYKWAGNWQYDEKEKTLHIQIIDNDRNPLTNSEMKKAPIATLYKSGKHPAYDYLALCVSMLGGIETLTEALIEELSIVCHGRNIDYLVNLFHVTESEADQICADWRSIALNGSPEYTGKETHVIREVRHQWRQDRKALAGSEPGGHVD